MWEQLDMFKYTAEGRKDAIQTNSSSAAAAVPSPVSHQVAPIDSYTY